MIEAAYRAVGMPAPWGHREPRDTRTVFELAGLDFKQAKYAEGVEHNALDDARNQAVGVIDAYALLGKAPASA
jgi:hypothetical protein